MTRFAERLRRILSSRGLTFAKLAREAERLFPNHPRCRIPRNFYNDLRTTALSPDIFQLFTLSAVSGYRLADWFSLFGFSPEEIPQLQLALPSKRTLLLDATHCLQPPDLSWSIPSRWNVPAVCPLLPFLRTLEVERDKSSPVLPPSERYLYARVGSEDALAFPDLLPGSLVRVDTTRAELHLPSRFGDRSSAIFLVEHARGLVCSRLLRIDHKRFALHTADLPYAQVPLEIGREANLLGVVDMELRRMRRSEGPVVPADLANFWKPEPLPPVQPHGELGNWIRSSRTRSGLHFREASRQSARIAELMRDPRYLVASGSLSDYEATERPPRHVHKIFSLCALYGLSLETFLEKSDLPLARVGRDPFPENLMPRREKDPAAPSLKPNGDSFSGPQFLQPIVTRSKDLPHFLVHGLARLTGLSAVSVHDVFWVGGSPASFHSRLQRVLFAVVDRRKKHPRQGAQRSASEQSLYVLLKRDGSFLCGRSTLKGRDLVLHSFSDGLSEPTYLRNRVDAEVVGQAVAVIRRVPPSS